MEVGNPRPRHRGVDAGDGLQQARREIFSPDVLDGIDQVVDPQALGVDRRLACVQCSQVVGSLGAGLCDVVRLGRLTGGGCGPQQPQLILSSRKRRFKMIAEFRDLAANVLQVVTKIVEIRIAQVRFLQLGLETRKLLFPTRDPFLDVNADALVGARHDLGRVERRGRRFRWLGGGLSRRRGASLGCWVLVGRCRGLCGLGLSAGYGEPKKDAQRPHDGPQSVDHQLSPISGGNLRSRDGNSPQPCPEIRWPDNESNVGFRRSVVAVHEY